jgi:hypothetical protein
MRVAAKFLSSKNARCFRQSCLAAPTKSLSTVAGDEDFFSFPRQTEGNIYDDNWSLCADGVVPAGNAFRNARIPVLTQRLPSKVEAGKIALQNPKYKGPFVTLEAGDGIEHDDFSDCLVDSQNHLSSGVDLFVEDAFLGSFASSRLGVRIVSDSPAAALILRSLLVFASLSLKLSVALII